MFERDNGQDEVLRALDEILDPCLVAAGHRISIVDMGLITRVESPVKRSKLESRLLRLAASSHIV